MRDIKQAFWIAGQNFYGWKKSPRIWMTFILAAILCLMLSDQIISHAIKYETILQVFEPFIWTYGDASSVMLSSLLLILLFADMPFISQATPYWLVRTKRKIWLAGQIIYVILATVIYNIFLAVMLPLKFIIVSYCANKKREVFEQWIEDKRKFMSWFAECINGIHEMKLWNLFQVKKSQFEGLQKDLMDSYKKNAMLDEYSTVSVVVIDTVVNALLYILSGLFIIKGEFTIGGAFAFITYSAYVVNPISALINIKYYFAQIEPSAKRLFELWGQPEELEMKLCEMKPEKIYQDRDMVFEVKNLVFGYEPGHPILNGISLCVKKGERIAIVGENGSGKSTLLNLLAGFYRPQKGIIKLYGAPVELMDIQDMRNRIAVISQRPYLFQGTIEENVNIDGKASRDAVVEACRKSGALGFIEKLDHGFGQKIGQDGAKLSGGERQKIAVARALLKNADILLMDEATEGFDVESNEALRELLHSELKNKTIVFITHKYKELESVDKVYRLSKGILELVRS